MFNVMKNRDLIKEYFEGTGNLSAEAETKYLCPNGVMTIEEFREYGHKIIDEEYDSLEW